MDIPKGVLPDSPPVAPGEGEKPVVVTPEVVTPPVAPVSPAPVVPEKPVETPPAPGSATPPENLLSALQEERRLRKEAEDKLANITSTPPVLETYTDEGKMLEGQINSLKGTIETLMEDKILDALYVQHPVLKDLSEEFRAYKAGFPQAKIEQVAKLFLSEKGMLEPIRKGLERPAGGGTPIVSDKLTTEEVSDLRKNNHRKYLEYLMSGKIRLDELG